MHLPFKAQTCVRSILNDALASPVPQIVPLRAHRARWFEPIPVARGTSDKYGFPVYAGPYELSRAGRHLQSRTGHSRHLPKEDLWPAGLSPPRLRDGFAAEFPRKSGVSAYVGNSNRFLKPFRRKSQEAFAWLFHADIGNVVPYRLDREALQALPFWSSPPRPCQSRSTIIGNLSGPHPARQQSALCGEAAAICPSSPIGSRTSRSRSEEVVPFQRTREPGSWPKSSLKRQSPATSAGLHILFKKALSR